MSGLRGSFAQALALLSGGLGSGQGLLAADEAENRRELEAIREKAASWRRSLAHVTRQTERRAIFVRCLKAVNSTNVLRDLNGRIQMESPNSHAAKPKYAPLRAERRNLARAYAAKAWRDRAALLEGGAK